MKTPPLPVPPSPPSGRTVHHGRRMEVCVVATAVGERDVIVHPGSVVVLPLLDATPGQETVVLIEQHRLALGGTLVEVVAGTRDKAESIEATALRELEEEAGYRAGVLTPLGAFYPAPGVSSELMWAFLATNLEPIPPRPEPDEQIRVVVWPLRELEQAVAEGRIVDGKILAMLSLYRLRRSPALFINGAMPAP